MSQDESFSNFFLQKCEPQLSLQFIQQKKGDFINVDRSGQIQSVRIYPYPIHIQPYPLSGFGLGTVSSVLDPRQAA